MTKNLTFFWSSTAPYTAITCMVHLVEHVNGIALSPFTL